MNLDLYAETIRTAIAKIVDDSQVLVFTPLEQKDTWYIVLLTKNGDVTSHLRAQGFEGVRLLGECKSNYTNGYLIEFTHHPFNKN